MPFLQFASSHIATNHLSSVIGESSKIVPTLVENCFLQPLHCHVKRVEMNECSADPQNGQVTPSGQRRLTIKSWQTCLSEKYRMASCSVSGRAFSMRPI